MIRNDATPVNRMIAAPTRIIAVEPSPIEPGMLPKKASIQFIWWPNASLRPFAPSAAH